MTGAELIDLLHGLRRDLDQFDTRISALEGQRGTNLEQRVVSLEARTAPWTFSQPGVTQRRRRTVVTMREDGFSYQAIAAALGVAVATVQRDLACTPHTTPDRVRGLDHKSHPAHKNGRNGSRPAA